MTIKCHTRLPIYMVLAVFTFFSALSLEAAGPRHESVDADVEEFKRPEKSKGKAAPAPRTRITRSQAFLIATETKLRGEIQKAITHLQRTVKRMPKGSKPRLAMRDRLVNLRLELAVYEANAEHSRRQ